MKQTSEYDDGWPYFWKLDEDDERQCQANDDGEATELLFFKNYKRRRRVIIKHHHEK
jgi:hypothetical protein